MRKEPNALPIPEEKTSRTTSQNNVKLTAALTTQKRKKNSNR